ncbi:MAG: DUF512 domain-containing protein [Negativicutes bacterium]
MLLVIVAGKKARLTEYLLMEVRDMQYKGIITGTAPNSIAQEVGLTCGDKLLAVNDQPISDLIDLSFALAEENVTLLIEKADGEQELIEIEKEYDEDLGIEFDSAVFDGVRRCANRCVFCFVDQMPPGMRESLYVKDDDYRLSFLYGNFVTLTNMNHEDLARINRLHLSPLYISVHTTDGGLRAKMLNNPQAGNIMAQLNALAESGIEMHTQVVLCPGLNDGAALEKTFQDLYALYPQVLSMAIVPVGLTKHRSQCPSLCGFTPEQAAHIIHTVQMWQSKCRREMGQTFVYLADEFYLAADMPIPEYDFYDEFPQLENGIGIVRCFLTEWEEFQPVLTSSQTEEWIDVVCGVSIAKILDPLLSSLSIPNRNIRLVPVDNTFFGSGVTVTGLLTGQDICKALRKLSGRRTGIILPGVALRKGESIFLDDTTSESISKEFDVPVRIAHSAQDLKQLLYDWR